MQLVDKQDKVLREIAKEVPPDEIKREHIQRVISDMKEALHKEDDGVAIAAPQIGVPLRIFVVAGKVLNYREDTEEAKEPEKIQNDLVFINPKITKTSRESEWLVEGCLSLRWLYGEVKRKKKVTVEAYDEEGKKVTRGASGLLAHVFQHETDHLDGILFVDKARAIENIPPEKQTNHKQITNKK